MSSKAKHVLRSHKTNQTPLHKSSDKLVPHGNPMHPTFSKKNKNKNRWPSWEDRRGKFKTVRISNRASRIIKRAYANRRVKLCFAHN